MDIQIFEDDIYYREATSAFAEAATLAIDARGTFSVALSGGETPEPLYALLAERYQESIPWEHVEVFFGDERCVPPEDPDSNYGMADRVLLSKVGILPQNVHRMKGEIDPEQAAREYEQEIRHVLGDDIVRFDLILLGMGEDGHTASLFPYSDALNETRCLVVPVKDPKHGHTRLTITPPVILSAREIIVLITGEDKAETVAEVLNGPYEPYMLPIQILVHASTEVHWLLDTAAASCLQTAVPQR